MVKNVTINKLKFTNFLPVTVLKIKNLNFLSATIIYLPEQCSRRG